MVVVGEGRKMGGGGGGEGREKREGEVASHHSMSNKPPIPPKCDNQEQFTRCRSQDLGVGPRGETLARTVRRKRAKIEDLELFFQVLQTRCGNIPFCCDQEECLREEEDWDCPQE